MPRASRKVCKRVSTGFRTVMCFTSTLFHRKRMNRVISAIQTIRIRRL